MAQKQNAIYMKYKKKHTNQNVREGFTFFAIYFKLQLKICIYIYKK